MDHQNTSRISDLIEKTMQERGCNQVQLAESLGLSKQSLNNLLRGRHAPSIETLSTIYEHDENFADKLLAILLPE